MADMEVLRYTDLALIKRADGKFVVKSDIIEEEYGTPLIEEVFDNQDNAVEFFDMFLPKGVA